MDPLSWIARNAPWVQPILAVPVILFFVSGPIPKAAHDAMLGDARDFREVAEAWDERLSEWAEGRALQVGELQIPDFIFQLVLSFIGSDDALGRHRGAMAGTWELRQLGPSWVFDESKGKLVTSTLLIALGLSIALRASSSKRDEETPGAKPAASVHREALLVDASGRPLRRGTTTLGVLGAWLGRHSFLFMEIAAVLALVVFLWLSAVTRTQFELPRKLPGRVLVAPVCPAVFERLPAAGQILYAAYFGTTPGVGTHVAFDREPTNEGGEGRRSQHVSLDHRRIGVPPLYFRGLARLTVWLYGIFAIGQILGSIGMRGTVTKAAFRILLFLALLIQAFQWMFLIDAYGRLHLAAASLSPLAEAAEVGLAGTGPADLLKEGTPRRWPFAVPYADGGDVEGTSVACKGTEATLLWSGVFPSTTWYLATRRGDGIGTRRLDCDEGTWLNKWKASIQCSATTYVWLSTSSSGSWRSSELLDVVEAE